MNIKKRGRPATKVYLDGQAPKVTHKYNLERYGKEVLNERSKKSFAKLKSDPVRYENYKNKCKERRNQKKLLLSKIVDNG